MRGGGLFDKAEHLKQGCSQQYCQSLWMYPQQGQGKCIVRWFVLCFFVFVLLFCFVFSGENGSFLAVGVLLEVY